MAFYDLKRPEDRSRMAKERQEELSAIENGSWPRDTNDLLRWSRMEKGYASKMCRAELAYLANLDLRIAEGEEVWGG